jgi:hypothetical protein
MQRGAGGEGEAAALPGGVLAVGDSVGRVVFLRLAGVGERSD